MEVRVLDRRSRLATLIAIRVVVSTFLLGWATLIQLNRPGAFPVDPFFFLIGVTYALSIAYLATLRSIERFPWLVDLQLGADAILVSGFIGLTGGIVSYFSSLYLMPIIAASIISFRRGAFQVAVLSGVLYFGLVTAQYLGHFPEWLGGDAVQLPGRQFAQYTIAINLFGFAAVALLSGSLAERLRHAQSRLQDAARSTLSAEQFARFEARQLRNDRSPSP